MGQLDDLQPGDPQRIGPYVLEGRLASGGMGRVYLGRSPGGRHVAVKVIRAELAQDAEFLARFSREVAAARKVSGIYTADVVDAGLDGPMPWLATSYVAGPSLADAVASRGPLPAASVLRLAAGLAEGLAAIHAAGVVHRDLKPSNVLLAEDGPRLIDFGISRSMEMSALTRTGMVIGSPGFMSPEQAQGRTVGPPSDIFSLGAVLAFAATGEGPFGGGPNEELLYRVVSAEPDTAKLPGEIRPLIERCLAKEPRRRPTAARLLAQLSTAPPSAGPQQAARPRPEPAAAGLPVHGPASPPLTATMLPHPGAERAAAPRRGSGQAWGPTVSTPERYPAAAPPPRLGAEMPPPRPGGDRRMPAAQRRRPSRRGRLIAVIAAVVLAAAGAGAFLAVKAGYIGSRAPARPGSSRQVSPPASSAAPRSSSPGAAVMAALGRDLARSAAVRPTIQTAIDGVRNCSQSPSSGQAAMRQAISTRQGIVTGLQALSPAGLPSGARLISTLTTAMQHSITADRHYQGWMADFAASGSGCGSDPGQNPEYAAGQDASAAATTAKRAFLDLWNPMAPRYGQQTYASTDF